MKWARIWLECWYGDTGTDMREDFDAATREEAEALTRAWLDAKSSDELLRMGWVTVAQVADEFAVFAVDHWKAARAREGHATK